jgi:hypothetical protein
MHWKASSLAGSAGVTGLNHERGWHSPIRATIDHALPHHNESNQEAQMPEDFRSLMNRMHDHYKSGANAAFVMPHYVQPAAIGITPAAAVTPAGFAKLKTSSSAQLPQIDEIAASANSHGERIVSESKAELLEALNAFERDKDRSRVVCRFGAVREKDKAGFGEVIDEAYDKMIAFGADKPREVQDLVEQGSDYVCSVITQASCASISFYEDAVRKITTGDVAQTSIPDAGKFVENGFAPTMKLLSAL